jgi:3-phenylpropionate/cinnamic acid dioxygenase small subunit
MRRTVAEQAPKTETLGLDDALARIRRLEDERAIEQTIYAYGDAIDTEGHERWLALFTEDGRFAWRPASGDTRASAPEDGWVFDLRGKAELRRWAVDEGGIQGFGHENHVSRPVMFVSLEPERAETLTWYLILRCQAGVTTVISTGRFRDRLVRLGDGTWLIQERLAEGAFPSGH